MSKEFEVYEFGKIPKMRQGGLLIVLYIHAYLPVRGEKYRSKLPKQGPLYTLGRWTNH
jgi:hypothetical protein